MYSITRVEHCVLQITVCIRAASALSLQPCVYNRITAVKCNSTSSPVLFLSYVRSRENEQNLSVLKLDLPLLLLVTFSGQYSTVWKMDNKCVCFLAGQFQDNLV